jgi:pimeloyl-ACP methyl ester carboxylesterase
VARTDAWASIRVPCLVLAFEHDIDSPPAHAHAAAARIPGAQFAVINDTSHLAPFTHPDPVATAVLDFFGAV